VAPLLHARPRRYPARTAATASADKISAIFSAAPACHQAAADPPSAGNAANLSGVGANSSLQVNIKCIGRTGPVIGGFTDGNAGGNAGQSVDRGGAVDSSGPYRPSLDVTLCGWRVRSDVPLMADLRPWAGDDRAADVSIRLGPVADLDDVVYATPFLHVGRDGTCRLEVAAVARYLIRSGREVVVDPRIDPAAAAVRTFLLGPALGLLCHQRCLFPLHAACVRLGSLAVALAGVSGTGKSTLAAVLAKRGHEVLADEVCVIDPAAPGGPAVLPSFPRIKLWRDSVEALGFSPHLFEANRAGQEKYHVVFRSAVGTVPDPVPLRAILLLSQSVQSRPEGQRPLPGMDAAAALSGLVYRRLPAERMGRDAGLRRDTAGVAATVPVVRFERRMDLGSLDGQADLLEGLGWP
jgi:hypothetical protein